MSGLVEVRSGTTLVADREDVAFDTADGLTLVGELATPRGRPPVATLVCLHPLPTHGGFMDSHVLRKAAARLPALADLAVLRFNTRGTSSPRGTSEGEFGDGVHEREDLAAAMAFVAERRLPSPWLVGWSFGTEVALKWGREHPGEGVILLSPPLRRTSLDEVRAWAGEERRITALVPEFDDFLRPEEAREKFAVAPNVEVVGVEGAKHLWVGENYTRTVLDEIVRRVNPAAYPLPNEWDGPAAVR
jgi:alpha/beta superfamily hydrolase